MKAAPEQPCAICGCEHTGYRCKNCGATIRRRTVIIQTTIYEFVACEDEELGAPFED